ncbi:MAG: Rne/Rng family ribonuclease [Acidimicrobiia bacterium]
MSDQIESAQMPGEPHGAVDRAEVSARSADETTEPTGAVDAGGVAPLEGSTGGADLDGASPARKRRRGSRGGRNRNRSGRSASDTDGGDADDDDDAAAGDDAPSTDGAGAADRPVAARAPRAPRRPAVQPKRAEPTDPDEMPDPPSEGKVQDLEVADRVLVRKPQIGDSRPAPTAVPSAAAADEVASAKPAVEPAAKNKRRRRSGAKGPGSNKPVQAGIDRGDRVEVDEETLERQRGRERKGRPVGRYAMVVHVNDQATQIAVLEGRSLIEHYVSRPTDDVGQIHGNVYLGRVQNVLPGMEAAFVDISTPKNAVLYRGDVQYEQEDILERGANPRIEQLLKPKQTIVCQVVKNPIGAKGARLTQEVSLPGRFVVLIPNSNTYGISKRLPDDERKRLRAILDKVKPAQHGVIVRTAAENVSAAELSRDVERLLSQWEQIEALAKRSQAPKLLYREPGMAVRVIREEFNREYRSVVIDDRELYEDVKSYVESISPALADRVEYYDAEVEGLPVFERFHVHEQVHKALERKVWLPSGGSLIIEHTEALTVIDVNTGKNVGSSNLEETVFANNLEAAEEIARQLRLRDIGGIIVIDFIDMEVREHRQSVITAFRDALARDKTRTQVFDISELGLVEMTRKRIGEGLLPSFSGACPTCEGRGIVVDHGLLD